MAIVLATVTRQQLEDMRLAIALGVIPYSQSTLSPVTDRRADCTGLISYHGCLPSSGPGTWLKAYSTETLVTQGKIRQIGRGELLRGDIVGHCGVGTATGGSSPIPGHAAVFLEASGDLIHIWDHGSGMGPKDRWVRWNAFSTGWLSVAKAWRYNHLVDGSPGGHSMFCQKGDRGDVVEYLQRQLLEVGGQLPQFGVDSDYGDEVGKAVAAVTGFSNGNVGGVPVQTIYGPEQMLALQRTFAAHFASGGVSEETVRSIARGEIAASKNVPA